LLLAFGGVGVLPLESLPYNTAIFSLANVVTISGYIVLIGLLTDMMGLITKVALN